MSELSELAIQRGHGPDVDVGIDSSSIQRVVVVRLVCLRSLAAAH